MAYFAAAFEPLVGPETPGNETLERILEAITRLRLNNPGFDDATLDLLDENINLFTPAQWVRIARILKLDITSASRECRQDD